MIRVLAGVLVLTVLFAACGSDDETVDDDATVTRDATATGTATADAPSDGGATDGGGVAVEGPCASVSDETMSELLDVAVTGVTIDATLCEYAPKDGAPRFEVLAADLFSNTAFDEVCSLEFDLSGRGEEVAGLGVEASWKARGGTAGGIDQLFVCTGDQFMTVTLYVPDDRTDDMLAVARSVAEAAIAGK